MSAFKELRKTWSRRPLCVGDFNERYIDGLYNLHSRSVGGRAFIVSNLLRYTVGGTGYSYNLSREKHSDNIIFILITTNGIRTLDASQ